MLLRVLRQRTHRDTAHDDGNIFAAVKVSDPPGFLQLRGERADGDEVEMLRQLGLFPQVGDFVVFDLELPRRQPGERQQSEARQRGDDAVAVHEPGQSQTEPGEFLIVRAHTAHGDQSDPFHKLAASHRVKVPAVTKLSTGIKNSARSRGWCASAKQQSGM